MSDNFEGEVRMQAQMYAVNANVEAMKVRNAECHQRYESPAWSEEDLNMRVTS